MHNVKNLPLTVDFQFLPLNHCVSENLGTKQSSTQQTLPYLYKFQNLFKIYIFIPCISDVFVMYKVHL
jgi:hypothetical protein